MSVTIVTTIAARRAASAALAATSAPRSARSRVAEGEFSAQFGLSLALKDVRLALQAAGDDGLAVLGCLAEEWQQAVDEGLGDQDLTVVTRWLEQQGGTS